MKPGYRKVHQFVDINEYQCKVYKAVFYLGKWFGSETTHANADDWLMCKPYDNVEDGDQFLFVGNEICEFAKNGGDKRSAKTRQRNER